MKPAIFFIALAGFAAAQTDGASQPALNDSSAAFVDSARNAMQRSAYDAAMNWAARARTARGREALDDAMIIGLCAGRGGDAARACAELSKYQSLDGPDSLKKAMRARLSYYQEKSFEEDAKKAAALGSTAGAAPAGDSSLAVLYFRNVGSNTAIDPLQKGFADMLITDLSQVAALRVVERARLAALMREISLDMAGVTDEKQRPRIARLCGVSRMIGGLIKAPDSQTIMVRAGIFSAANAQSKLTSELKGALTSVFSLEKTAAFDIIKSLGITVTDAEREKIQKVKTENLLAFMAYCRGIDAMDNGNYAAAKAEFSEAVKLDPNFADAQTQADAAAAREDEGRLSTPPPAAMAPPPVAPVSFQGSGPMAVAPVKTEIAVPTRGFMGVSPTAQRMATVSGSAFMSELPVSMPAAQQNAAAPAVAPSDAGSGPQTSGGSGSTMTRPDYQDFTGSLLQKKANVTVLIPN